MSNPQINAISYSFVMLWSRIVSIPLIEESQAKLLFDKPDVTQYNTDINGITIHEILELEQGIGENGETIFTVKSQVKPTINLAPKRLLIFSSSLDSVLTIHKKFAELLNSIDSLFVQSLATAQLGINIEYEVNLGNEFSATDWMKYPSLQDISKSQFKKVIPNQYKFQLIEDSLNKNLQIDIQPREGKENSIFISVNDHYGISPLPGYSDEKNLKPYFLKSEDKLKKQIIPLLLKD